MTIYQPEDKTLTKERIEAILIALNHLQGENQPVEIIPTLTDLNRLDNLKGSFSFSEKGEIVFVAQ